jgi:hypothetical protein
VMGMSIPSFIAITPANLLLELLLDLMTCQIRNELNISLRYGILVTVGVHTHLKFHILLSC